MRKRTFILGQSREPGTSYAVLYSLQRMVGRKCDFRTYADTEVMYVEDNQRLLSTIKANIKGLFIFPVK